MDKVGFFDEILQAYTEYKVSYAKDGEYINKKHIYIAPNNKHLKVRDSYFYLSDDDKYNFAKPSISLSYASFSECYKEKLLVIQECGYCDDGVDKLEYLRSNNSKIILQNMNECEAKPMIQNAIKVGVQHYIFTLKEIQRYLEYLSQSLNEDDLISYLLEMIYDKYCYDFRLYHRKMLKRRFDIFATKHGVKNVKNAVGLILFDVNAFKAFFLDVSINVTEFFRKPKSFNQISLILNTRYKHAQHLKVWSAGCSSGEEVYSLAILLDNLNFLEKSIIYATDFNSVVLQEAKNGIFSKDSYIQAEENLIKVDLNIDLNQYFTKNDNFSCINEKIKKKTLFFQHNLATDSSFNEFDIIICNNVIIYFDYQLQIKVFKLFYDSLKFGGYLVLGKSEMLVQELADKFDRCSDN